MSFNNFVTIFFAYISMSEDLSPEYSKKTKERLHEKAFEKYQSVFDILRDYYFLKSNDFEKFFDS